MEEGRLSSFKPVEPIVESQALVLLPEATLKYLGRQNEFMGRIEGITRTELKEAPSTPGILRELAFGSDRAMFIRAKVKGNVSTGWHHHGDREVFGYVVRGRLRFQYGPGGKETTDVETNGYFHLPPGIIHRDVNPWPEEQEVVIAFVGTGPLVVNLDGPEPV